jgi:hypothetical protein
MHTGIIHNTLDTNVICTWRISRKTSLLSIILKASILSPGKNSDLYSECNRLKTRSKYRLSWLRFFMDFLTPLRIMPGYYIKPGHDSFLPNTIYYSLTILAFNAVGWYTGCVIKPSYQPWINKYLVTDFIKALPDNSSVNTSKLSTIQRKLCFLCGLRPSTIWTGCSVTSC